MSKNHHSFVHHNWPYKCLDLYLLHIKAQERAKVAFFAMPNPFSKKYERSSLSKLTGVIKLYSRTCSVGKSGPYMNVRTRDVSATLTRCHCTTSASWCRQVAHRSRNVRHRGGDGKYLEQPSSHSSNSTDSTRSHSRSPTSSANERERGLY